VISRIDKDELVKFTQRLISIPSVFNPDIIGMNEEAVAKFIAKYLEDLGFEVSYEEVVPGRPNVIAIFDGIEEGKTLLFEGHTDVVTAGNLKEWTYPPFGGEIHNNRIYGRGACDTKGNLAAMIFAAKAIKESKATFKGRILLCIPCDEEGMMLGIKDFIKKGWADKVDGAVICEPEENQICITQKGAMRAVVKIHGKMAHGAMPLSGLNPNTRMARFIVELEKYENQEMERLGCHPYLGLPSLTPTILKAPIEGDAQINVVPSGCMTTLDIRTVPGQEHEQIKKDIKDIFKKLKEADEKFEGEIEYIEERPWTLTDKGEPVVKAIAKAYHLVTGKEPVYNGVPGATDGTFLYSLKGIPIVTTGAGDRLIPHQRNEYVDIDELIEASRMFVATALLYLNDNYN
jgi:succinyl-diaminopimelate desuccinylase